MVVWALSDNDPATESMGRLAAAWWHARRTRFGPKSLDKVALRLDQLRPGAASPAATGARSHLAVQNTYFPEQRGFLRPAGMTVGRIILPRALPLASSSGFFMRIDAIPIGEDPPHDVNVIIEVPVGGEPIKYELDKDAGHAVRRSLPLHGDALSRQLRLHLAYAVRMTAIPCDVLVANTRAIVPGAVMSVRPVGVLMMEDEAGGDEKISRCRPRS